MPEKTQNPLHQSAFKPSDATILETDVVHKDYARVERLTIEHALFAGGRSSRLTRELFISGDAVMVIPYDPVMGCVLLIEQFRVAPLHHGEHPWIIEGIAGRIDTAEEPATVARREAIEEAGCTLDEMEEIGRFYQSPGIFAERITYYCARANLSAAGGLFGLEAEGEDIRALVVPLEEALAALEDGRIVSAPTALALMWIDRNQGRLRDLWQKQPT